MGYTYDTPSRFLPYPSGYSHDLSLITSKTLPLVQSPPGVGEVVGWANCEEALDGKPVFTCLLNVSVDKAQTNQGDFGVKNNTESRCDGIRISMGKRCCLSKRINSLEDRVRLYHGPRLVWKCTLRWKTNRQICQGPAFSKLSQTIHKFGCCRK